MDLSVLQKNVLLMKTILFNPGKYTERFLTFFSSCKCHPRKAKQHLYRNGIQRLNIIKYSSVFFVAVEYDEMNKVHTLN